MSTTESKYYDLSEDTQKEIQAIMDKLALPFNIKIKYLGDSKMKKVIKLQKANDVTSHLTKIDLLVFINEDYYINMEAKGSEILVYQEFDRLAFDIAKGTFKIGNFILQTNPGVLKKYGIDAVAEANQLTDLYTQQKKESDADAKQSKEDGKIGFKFKKTASKSSVEFLD